MGMKLQKLMLNEQKTLNQARENRDSIMQHPGVNTSIT
jgi:hypothetical protein